MDFNTVIHIARISCRLVFSNFFLRGNIHISINFSRKCDPLQYFGVNYDGFFHPVHEFVYLYNIAGFCRYFSSRKLLYSGARA